MVMLHVPVMGTGTELIVKVYKEGKQFYMLLFSACLWEGRLLKFVFLIATIALHRYPCHP